MVYIAAQVSLTCGGWAWVGSAHWGLFPQAGRPAAPSAAGENPCVARTASNACRCGSSRRAHPLGAGVVRRHVRLHCRASLGRRAGPLTLVSRPLDEHRRRPFKTLVSCVGRLVAGRLTTRMSTHNNWDAATCHALLAAECLRQQQTLMWAVELIIRFCYIGKGQGGNRRAAEGDELAHTDDCQQKSRSTWMWCDDSSPMESCPGELCLGPWIHPAFHSTISSLRLSFVHNRAAHWPHAPWRAVATSQTRNPAPRSPASY